MEDSEESEVDPPSSMLHPRSRIAAPPMIRRCCPRSGSGSLLSWRGV